MKNCSDLFMSVRLNRRRMSFARFGLVCCLSAILCLSGLLVCPAQAQEVRDVSRGKTGPMYMGSVSVGTYGFLACPLISPFFGPLGVSVFTSHGVYFPKARVYTGISLELINFNYGLGYASHTKYYFKSNKIAKPFVGVEVGGFSEFSVLADHRPEAYIDGQKAYFYAVPSVGIANCFRKVVFEVSIRTLIIPGITVEKGSWQSGIGVVLGLTF